MERFSEEHKPLREQVDTLNAIRKAISSVSADDVQSRNTGSISEPQKTQDVPTQPAPKKNRRKDDYSLE